MNRRKVLLLGCRGQLGSELAAALAPWVNLTAWSRDDLNLADLADIAPALEALKPDLVINAAAYTNVDLAEAEPDMAMRVNGDAPGEIARACARLGAALIHYSTDFVFDGEAGRAYCETDATAPLQVYGASKLAGERAIEAAGGTALVFRTGWLYHLGFLSFPARVLAQARRQKRLEAVTDQVGGPTWARRLALATTEVVRSEAAWEVDGVFHYASRGTCSRYEWAAATLTHDPRLEEQVCETLEPVRSDAFTGPRRPRYSVLDCARFDAVFGLERQEWETDLLTALKGV